MRLQAGLNAVREISPLCQSDRLAILLYEHSQDALDSSTGQQAHGSQSSADSGTAKLALGPGANKANILCSLYTWHSVKRLRRVTGRLPRGRFFHLCRSRYDRGGSSNVLLANKTQLCTR